MLWPCSGPKSRVRRINMSSVPWRRSTRVCFPALFSLDITPPVDFRPEYPAAQVECQWEMGRMSMGEANFSTRACARGLLHWKFSSYANWLGIEGRQTLRYGERQRPEYRSKDLSIGAQVADAPCTVSMGAPHRIYDRPRLTCRFATTMLFIRIGARSSCTLSPSFRPEGGGASRAAQSPKRPRLRTCA